jgi:hypothetical protein
MTMKKRQIKWASLTRCAICGRSVPDYDVVHLTSQERGSRTLCNACRNKEVAALGGLGAFEHVQFEPVKLSDCAGTTHEFHFRARLFGLGVAMEAFELVDNRPAGYQFEIIGNPEDDQLDLLSRLIEKIRRGLSIKHLEKYERSLQIADHQTVRGGIGSDESEGGQQPLLTIDGQEITWREFGRMMMTFEGWQFKLEIKDRSEEL